MHTPYAGAAGMLLHINEEFTNHANRQIEIISFVVKLRS
jgi:hypothetical protein